MDINFSKIKYFFLDVIVWIAAHWWFAAAVAIFLLVLLIVGQIQSCNNGRNERKIENTKQEIIEDKINSNVMQNIVDQKANVSNQSLKNINAVINKPVNSFDNNFVNARKRFCESFPEDCK